MTCCAQDIQFLGYEVKNETDVKVKDGDYIYLTCTVSREYSKLAKEEVIMLHASSVVVMPKHKEEVLGMN